MISSAIVGRYASALADVITGASGMDAAQAVRELKSFEAVLASSLELRHALASPAVSPGRKRAVMGRLVQTLSLSKVVRNFLLVLTDHRQQEIDRKSTRLNSSHLVISYAVFC